MTLRGVHPLESSSAWGWPLLARPFVFLLLKGVAVGVDGCSVPVGSTCTQTMMALGTPVLWWLGALALIDGIYLMLARRDWRFTVPLLGVAATWLPWLGYGDRPIYAYYAVAMIPFTVIGLVLVMERFVAPAREAARRVTTARAAVVVVVVLVIANFAWEWPALVGRPMSNQELRGARLLPELAPAHRIGYDSRRRLRATTPDRLLRRGACTRLAATDHPARGGR